MPLFLDVHFKQKFAFLFIYPRMYKVNQVLIILKLGVSTQSLSKQPLVI